MHNYILRKIPPFQESWLRTCLRAAKQLTHETNQLTHEANQLTHEANQLTLRAEKLDKALSQQRDFTVRASYAL